MPTAVFHSHRGECCGQSELLIDRKLCFQRCQCQWLYRNLMNPVFFRCYGQTAEQQWYRDRNHHFFIQRCIQFLRAGTRYLQCKLYHTIRILPDSPNVGSDDTKDSDPVNGTVSNVVLALNQANTSADAGFVQAVLALGNRFRYDTNNDGINGSSETVLKE